MGKKTLSEYDAQHIDVNIKDPNIYHKNRYINTDHVRVVDAVPTNIRRDNVINDASEKFYNFANKVNTITSAINTNTEQLTDINTQIKELDNTDISTKLEKNYNNLVIIAKNIKTRSEQIQALIEQKKTDDNTISLLGGKVSVNMNVNQNEPHEVYIKDQLNKFKLIYQRDILNMCLIDACDKIIAYNYISFAINKQLDIIKHICDLTTNISPSESKLEETKQKWFQLSTEALKTYFKYQHQGNDLITQISGKSGNSKTLNELLLTINKHTNADTNKNKFTHYNKHNMPIQDAIELFMNTVAQFNGDEEYDKVKREIIAAINNDTNLPDQTLNNLPVDTPDDDNLLLTINRYTSVPQKDMNNSPSNVHAVNSVISYINSFLKEYNNNNPYPVYNNFYEYMKPFISSTFLNSDKVKYRLNEIKQEMLTINPTQQPYK